MTLPFTFWTVEITVFFQRRSEFGQSKHSGLWPSAVCANKLLVVFVVYLIINNILLELFRI